MLKISRYIFFRLSFVTFLVSFTLTTLVCLLFAMRLIDGVLHNNLSVLSFFEILSMMIPDLSLFVVPAALLISIVFVYTRMMSDQEIPALRSIGMSHLQLARPGLFLALIITFLLLMNSFYLVPATHKNIRKIKTEMSLSLSASMLQAGTFHTFNNVTIYIKERDNNKSLRGVMLYSKLQGANSFIITAREGSIVETPAGVRLILIDGRRQEVNSKTGKPNIVYFEQFTTDTFQSNPQKVVNKLLPEELTVPQLIWLSSKEMTNLEINKFRAHGHYRLLNPLHAFIFALMALSLLLSAEMSRRPKYRRTFLIMVLAVAIQTSTMLSSYLAAEHLYYISIGYINLLLICLYFTYNMLFKGVKGQ